VTDVLVIGDSCQDIFIYGNCQRMCPDAPVPIFLPTQIKKNGGMAANVAANLKSLGVQCDLVSNLEEIEKTRYIDEKTNHMFLRVDSNEENIERIKILNKEMISKYKLIVISDYNKGFLADEDIDFICTNHDNVFIDTKKILGKWYTKAKFIKINEKEYMKTKFTLEGEKNIIVTLGALGCRHLNKVFAVKKVDVKDMSGAGDTFLSGLVAKYLKTNNINKSIMFANECATKVVQQRGVNVI